MVNYILQKDLKIKFLNNKNRPLLTHFNAINKGDFITKFIMGR